MIQVKTEKGAVKRVATLATRAVTACLAISMFSGAATSPTMAVGLVGPHGIRPVRAGVPLTKLKRRAAGGQRVPGPRNFKTSARHSRLAAARHGKKGRLARVVKKAAVARAIPPQKYTDDMAGQVVAPGVVHKYYRGALNVHVLDIDLKSAPVKVRPILAGDTFHRLKDVTDHARESHALAAVNANYFKTNGTPLGTLIIDGEWIAGPLYDRVSMGLTRSGFVRIDRVNLYGIIKTSNPEVPTIWANTINQPRRTGTRLVVYTRRWGQFVKIPYAGTLVAVNAQGEVIDKSTNEMEIPYGGYVFSDSKNAAISKLQRGDVVNLKWHNRPNDWDDVVQAVSGGPMLVKDGKVQIDLKGEHFRKGWTGAQIRARTAAGVTDDNHLILATIEGPHTLWDVAKFLKQLGCVDAMNLDGGGSTTMVVKGVTVTRNNNAHQRRVASSIAVFDERTAALLERNNTSAYRPQTNLTQFEVPPVVQSTTPPAAPDFAGGAIADQQPYMTVDSTMDEVASARQRNTADKLVDPGIPADRSGYTDPGLPQD